MRKWKKILIITAALCILTGCGGAASASVNTVSIQNDGKIEHTIVEQFDRNYYDADELSEMAKERVDRYNAGTGSITCESVESGSGKIVVKMIYQSEADYTKFNNRELFYGTVGQASQSGYTLSGIVSVDGEAIDDAGLETFADNHIVIVQTKNGEELNVRVYDKILCGSENLTFSGKKDALITAADAETLSYIIFQ